MIVFENPNYLYLFLIIPLMIILHYFSLLTFKKRSFKFANFETIKRISGDKDIFSKNISQLLLRILFVTLLILGIAGVGYEVERQGISNEIIFALDTSGSMLATDLEPDRLEATKQSLEDFIANISVETPIGLVSFTSLAYIEQGLTLDRLALLDSLDDIEVRKTSGTSLGSAISISVAMFNPESERDKAIVIFTDGQENILSEEELLEIVGYATSSNVRIFVIGVGSVTGAPIRNNTVGNSVINEGTIKLIIDRNGGQSRIAQTKESITRSLREFFVLQLIERVVDVSVWMLVLAFIVLIFEWYFVNYVGKSFP